MFCVICIVALGRGNRQILCDLKLSLLGEGGSVQENFEIVDLAGWGVF